MENVPSDIVAVRDAPDWFLWGAATAAFQIEGAARCDGKGPSIWDVFCATPGKTVRGETGDVTCDHVRRYREDVELMRRLNLGAYRFSVSWPRVMPRGRGARNPAGLDFYDRLVDELCAADIEPVPTLYHWDLPAALRDELGGWAHPDSPGLFADYSGLVADRLGDRVRIWITLNEPWCVVDGGYFSGRHAPGMVDRELGYRVGHNLLRAHAHAADRLRTGKHPAHSVTLAINSTYYFPASDAAPDVAAAERALLNFGGWFLDPVCLGDYPVVMRERLGNLLPAFTPEDRRLLQGSLDCIALNYYSSEAVRYAAGKGPMEVQSVPRSDWPQTAMGWSVVPEGLHRLLVWVDERYGGLPIYITENGAAFKDVPDERGYVDDPLRIDYLQRHLAACAAAVSEGVDLRGYFVWSLLDNLEWSEGFDKRFGIVRCDHETQKRTIKASGRWYADMIAAGGYRGLPAGRRAAPGATP